MRLHELKNEAIVNNVTVELIWFFTKNIDGMKRPHSGWSD